MQVKVFEDDDFKSNITLGASDVLTITDATGREVFIINMTGADSCELRVKSDNYLVDPTIYSPTSK